MKTYNTEVFKKSFQNFLYSLLAILIGFIVGALVLLITGYDPVSAYSTLFRGIFSKPRFLIQSLIDATPLILTGLSVTFAFKTGLFNIGAEGQYIMGSLVATVIALSLPLPAIILPIVCILGGAFAGCIWGGIVGLLKAKKGIHEVITSIMLNWIAFYFSNFLVLNPAFREPDQESTRLIPETARISISVPEDWQTIIGKTTKLNYGIVVMLLVVIIVIIILNKTTLGYRLKAVGYNPHAAKACGINVYRSLFTSMAISGMLAGMAGALQICGVQYFISQLGDMEAYGFNGLAVAFIGNINPFGTLLGGLFFGALNFGGNKLTLAAVPKEVVNILMGTVVYFVAATAALKTLASNFKLRKKK